MAVATLSKLEVGVSVYLVDESNQGNHYRIETWLGQDVSHIDFNVKGVYACPMCESEGGDRSGDNFHCFGLDGDDKPLGGYCFKDDHFKIPSLARLESGELSGSGNNGGKFNVSGSRVVNNSSNNSGIKRQQVRKLPKDFYDTVITQDQIDDIISKTTDTLTVKYRGLQRYNEVNKALGIRYKVVDSKVKEMYVPYYYYDGNVRLTTGYQVRVVDSKSFYFIGRVTNDVNEFIGKSYRPKVADTLIIVGGAVDYVTTQGAINDLMAKYKSHNINVVSTVTGEASLAESIKNDYEWVVAHKKIILALDNDEAGWKAIDKAISVLPSEQCYTANFGNYNDPNSYALDNAQLLQDIYWNVQSVDDFGYVGADELFDMGLEVLNQEKIKFPSFLSDLAQFFTDGEIGLGEWVNIIAATSAGKSTIIDAWKDSWIDICPYKQAVNSFEASGGKYCIKEVSSMAGRNIIRMSGKQNRIDYYNDLKQQYMDRVIGDDGKPKYYFVSKVPKCIEQFKKMLLRLVKVEGVGVVWIDPALSLKALCFNDKEFNDLLLWIDQTIRLDMNVTIVTVQHTRKNLSSGKNASQGGELAEEDGEGTRMLISLATVNIGVERDKEANCPIEKNTTKLSLFKNRTDQMTGRHIAKLFYRVKANRLYPYSVAMEHNFFRSDEFVSVEDIDLELNTDHDGYDIHRITNDPDAYEKKVDVVSSDDDGDDNLPW